jgi:hypothetical protein
MPYTATWDETQPLGTAAANTIDDVLRAFKRDIRERQNDALGISDFATADPVRIGILRFTNKIVPPAAGFTVRNNADGADNLVVTDAGALTARTTITATTGFVGTINTAAQANITSLGTLTALNVTGTVTIVGVINHSGGDINTDNDIYISGGAGSHRILGFRTSGLARWIFRATNEAEAGANAGSNLALDNYDDAGAYINTPLTLARATGIPTFWTAVNLNSSLTVGNGLTVSAGGASITGALSVSAGITGTINTPAQGNITSLGTLTSLTVSGTTTLGSSVELGSTTVAGPIFIDFHSDGTGIDHNARILRNSGANANFDIVNVGTGSIAFYTNGTVRWAIDVAGGWVAGVDASYDIASASVRARALYTVALKGNGTDLWYDSDTHTFRNGAGGSNYLTVANAGLTITADIFMSNAASKIIAGATSFAIRDNTNVRNNLLVSNAGVVTTFSNLVVGGAISLTTAVSVLVPGATSFAIRNNADSANNLIINNAGTANFAGASPAIQIAGTQVVGARVTGWDVPTSSAAGSRGNYDINTITLPQLAQQVDWLIEDLKTHGLLGA